MGIDSLGWTRGEERRYSFESVVVDRWMQRGAVGKCRGRSHRVVGCLSKTKECMVVNDRGGQRSEGGKERVSTLGAKPTT